MRVTFFTQAFDDYVEWQKIDRKIANKINALIADIRRHPFEGLGHPEPLKHNKRGMWSRRIDHEHRLVYYQKADDEIAVIECKGHYE